MTTMAAMLKIQDGPIFVRLPVALTVPNFMLLSQIAQFLAKPPH